MEYFAIQEGDNTIMALIAIISTVIISMFTLINYLLKRSDKTIQANTRSGDKQATATLELSKAVAQLNTSIIERDSQDREFHKQVMVQFEKLHNKTDALTTRQEQIHDTINATSMNVRNLYVNRENTPSKRRNNASSKTSNTVGTGKQ
jgi:predicted phage gp36 major capsid-like protein